MRPNTEPEQTALAHFLRDFQYKFQRICFLQSYLCQAHILLLNGVVQTVAERPGQQQVGGLSDHVVDLCGAETYTDGLKQTQHQGHIPPHPGARINTLS